MRRAVVFAFVFAAGCVYLEPSNNARGRVNIKFCQNATKEEKLDFFKRHNLKPIAYNIFGYDVAEWAGTPPNIARPLFSELSVCANKPAEDEMLVREYEIENQRLDRAVQMGRRASKKTAKMTAAADTTWFEAFIRSEKAHKFLEEKKIPLWPNGIVVADEGLNFAHPDIKPVLKYDKDKKPVFWMGQGRKIGDFVGIHATLISCLVAGYRDGHGIEGVAAKNAYILPLFLKFNLKDGSFASDVAIGLAHYAELERKGEISFHVVNMSFVMLYESNIVFAAIKNMKDKLFIAAGGNVEDGQVSKDIDEEKYYPANWKLPNIIAVVATDQKDNFASEISNYGPKRTGIAAPGVAIRSCGNGEWYEIEDGSSFSTAIVSGAVSLLYSINPFMDEEAAKYALLLGATAKNNLMDKVKGGRRLNVYASARLVYDLMYGSYID